MFYSDKPIFSHEDDLFNRDCLAKMVAHGIINLDSSDTFTVGLFGKWGSGKTSFINLMLQEIDKEQQTLQKNEKFIVVHFEPWNFSDTNQLLTQFFIRLSNEFRSKRDKKLAEIGEALEKYSDAFEIAEVIPSTAGAILSRWGKQITSKLGKKLKKAADEKDILKQKEYVVRLLEKQSNRILIVIDDIERLSNAEIRQVFQLITSVAKFPNTTYLLVFDKDIVVRALEKVQEGSGESYLEKIIQIPIQLPDIQKQELRKVLFSYLEKIIEENHELVFFQQHWQNVFESCIDPFIKTIRDIKRLCNTIQFKLTAISAEIDFTDMVAITVMEIYLPSIYEWVKDNKDLLTGGFLEQTSANIKNKRPSDWLEFYRQQFKYLLETHKFCENIDAEAELAITVISHLFPYFGQKVGKIYEVFNIEQLRRNNQIAHSEKFDRYFHLNLDLIKVKKSTILNAIQLFSCDQFMECLLEQDRDGNSYEFLEEIRAMISNISIERAKVVIEALIKVSSKLDTVSKNTFLSLSSGKYANYIILDLINKLPTNDRLIYISKTINNADLDSLQTCAFIMNRIELSHGRLAANGAKEKDEQIITLDELIQLESIFIKKIKDTLKSNSIFDFNDWRMLWYLLECFEPDYAKTYLICSFNDDKNILKYMECSVSIWTGSGTMYEITNEYKKYLTEENVLKAIESQYRTGKIFELSERLQNKCGAFYLHSIEKSRYGNQISQSDVDELLSQWKASVHI